MGVMSCSRNSCTNIMCDKHSHDYGYICDECLEELSATDEQSIGEFMGSEKKNVSSSDAWGEYVNSVFGGVS